MQPDSAADLDTAASEVLVQFGHFLSEHDWTYEIEDGVLHTGSGEAKKYYFPISIHYVEEVSVLQLAAFIEVDVPEPVQPVFAQLLNEINQHLYVGHLEYRPEEGGVLFRYGLFINPSEQWLTSMLTVFRVAIEVCGTYADVLRHVGAGGSIDDAWELLKKDDEPEWARDATDTAQ